MNIFHNLAAWWSVIWHHAHAGTLPAAPVAGGPTVAVAPPNPSISTPPAPSTVPTPPATPAPTPPVVVKPDANPAPAAPPAPPVDPALAGVTIADDDNGLVRFAGQESVPGLTAENVFCYAPAEALFDPHSQGAFTIAWNCGQVQSAEDHPQTGLLSQRAVTACHWALVPGTDVYQWQPKGGENIAHSLTIPPHLKTPADALAYAAKVAAESTGNGQNFHA